MNEKLFLIFSLIFLFECYAHKNFKRETKSTQKTKRQLYREQLLPQKGGKIPDSAFQVDRLAANRLSKVGISVPDGVLLEQRHQESHYNEHRLDLDIQRSIVRLKQTPDGRFTPTEGRYPTFENEVESTYVIRSPVIENYNYILPAFRPNFAGSPAIQIPSKLTNNKIFREKNTMPQRLNNQQHVAPAPNRASAPQQVHPLPQQQQADWSTNSNTIYPEMYYQSIGFENARNTGYIPNFPSLTQIPFTSFICDRSGGMYPDPEAKCQNFFHNSAHVNVSPLHKPLKTLCRWVPLGFYDSLNLLSDFRVRRGGTNSSSEEHTKAAIRIAYFNSLIVASK